MGAGRRLLPPKGPRRQGRVDQRLLQKLAGGERRRHRRHGGRFLLGSEHDDRGHGVGVASRNDVVDKLLEVGHATVDASLEHQHVHTVRAHSAQHFSQCFHVGSTEPRVSKIGTLLRAKHSGCWYRGSDFRQFAHGSHDAQRACYSLSLSPTARE
eukprot:130226-Prymnesium_polylepis.1